MIYRTDRYNSLIEHLTKFKVMSRDHIITILFSDIKDKVKKCNRMMDKLTKEGIVKPIKNIYRTYHYVLGERFTKGDIKPLSPKYFHHLRVVDLYCELRKLPIQVLKFDSDPYIGFDTDLSSPDLILYFKLPDNNKIVLFFEIQQSNTTNNRFSEKINGYNDLFKSGLTEQLGYPSLDKFNVITISDKIYNFNVPNNIKTYQFQTETDFIEIFMKPLIEESLDNLRERLFN